MYMVSMMHLVMTGNHDVPPHWDGPLSLLFTWWSPTETCPTLVAFKAVKASPPQMLCYTNNQKEFLGCVILSAAGHLILLSLSFIVCSPQGLSLSLSRMPSGLQVSSDEGILGTPTPTGLKAALMPGSHTLVSVCLCYPCFPFSSFDFSN